MSFYPFLAVFFLWNISLFSGQKEDMFSAQDTQVILSRPDQKEDLIVLNDGTQLKGKVPKFPQLRFFFGNIPINIDDGAAAAFRTVDGQEKMQVITREGHCLIGQMPKEKITLVQSFPSIDYPSYTAEQEIDPCTIDCIFFKKRREARSLAPASFLHTLSLKNGDQLPIVFADDSIPLSNGWKDILLQTDEIVHVNFDGGLYGKLEDDRGNSVELDYAFVKDNYLHVQVAGGTQKLGIPWEHIASIRKEHPLSSHDQVVGNTFAQQIIQEQHMQEAVEGHREGDFNTSQEGAIALNSEKEEAYAAFLELELTRSRVLRQALNELTSRQKNRLLSEQELKHQIDELKHVLDQEKNASQNRCLKLEESIGQKEEEIEKIQLTYGEIYDELIDQITRQKEQIRNLQEKLQTKLSDYEAQSDLDGQRSLQSSTQEKMVESENEEDAIVQLEK
ncbi:MAG: hypothetical protein WB791_02485 [Waddliaceae bacterium]